MTFDMAKKFTPPVRTAKIGLTDFEGRFFFQVTFAMGPHKHETY